MHAWATPQGVNILSMGMWACSQRPTHRASKEAILNHFQVTDSIASSGQPAEAQFAEIAAGGCDVIINLAMPDNDNENAIATEGSIITSLGMICIHIPVAFDAPTEQHFARFSGYMDTLKDNKVWVHCVVNARVLALLFRCLQSSSGLTADEAKTPVLMAWLPKMDDVWKAFISHAPEHSKSQVSGLSAMESSQNVDVW